ncbi:hypothetical protein BS17DRAFT_807006 [Gyrodon lividus]|nr:hypothetical protein BS17DRAFT_807006 [Gyrodon lividus]
MHKGSQYDYTSVNQTQHVTSRGTAKDDGTGWIARCHVSIDLTQGTWILWGWEQIEGLMMHQSCDHLVIERKAPPEKGFKAYRTAISSVDDNSPPKLYQLFDLILDDPRGGPLFSRWIEDQAVDMVPSKAYDEMDDCISDGSCEEAEYKEGINYHMVIPTWIVVLSLQWNYLARIQRSHHSLYLAASFTITITLWTNGASQQKIEMLANCGLCISFSSLTTLLKTLASRSLDRAIQVAQGPHIFCYNNINISTSTFVKRSSAPAKVQPGTFPIMYRVRNGNHEHIAKIAQSALWKMAVEHA